MSKSTFFFKDWVNKRILLSLQQPVGAGQKKNDDEVVVGIVRLDHVKGGLSAWKFCEGFLTAGQAADITVLCAGLVHEGAVGAGPHGGGGGWSRRTAHRLVSQRAGWLPAHRTWRRGEEQVRGWSPHLEHL